MLSAEGELHRRFKSQCNPPFNMRSVHGHAMPLITARADALIDGFAEDRSTDLRPSLASQLAVYTVASVLGIPADLHARILGWYASFAAALANFTWDEQIRARGHASAREFQDAIAPVMRDLERTSDSSLLGALTRADAATRLTDPEIISNALIVLFGGIETTESTILNVIWALLSHPAALAAIRADGTLLPAGIEEAMRWEPAVQSCTRHIEQPVTLCGVTIVPARQSSACSAPRTATRIISPTRTATTSPAPTPAITSPSAPGSTSASALPSLERRCW